MYKTKSTALKNLKKDWILCNKGIKEYFHIQNHTDFLELIEKSDHPVYYEYISKLVPVKLFFDIDIEPTNKHFDNPYDSLLPIIEKFGNEYILLSAHSSDKKSFHIIYPTIYFKNVLELKKYLQSIFDKSTFDYSVYREGLFRTILSHKDYKKNRPFIIDNTSPIKDNYLDTFITNVPDNVTFFQVTKERQLKKKLTNKESNVESNNEYNNEKLHLFVKSNYNYNKKDITSIKYDHKIKCIIIGINDTFCSNINREHKSNNQYIIINCTESKQKCHDLECVGYKKTIISFESFGKEIQDLIISVFDIDQVEIDNLKNVTQDLNNYVVENFQDPNVNFNYDRSNCMFKSNADPTLQTYLRGRKCIGQCQLEHIVRNGNSFTLKCNVCGEIFPKDEGLVINPIKYPQAAQFWVQVNNNNVYNTTIIQGGEESFVCDVSIDTTILNNPEVTSLVNQILDGHKISKFGELLKIQYDNFVFENEIWYHFNDIIWKKDISTIQFKKCILDSSNMLDVIQRHYSSLSSNPVNDKIINNIKSLITKLNKPGFKKEIVEDAKLFFYENDFSSKLNSKKHLVPFTNGAFDLLTHEFRSTNKNDFISLTTKYTYDSTINNDQVHTFINNILPNKNVRDYVLKKMSECLNGDIPNTHFLMFVGDGANGKSQLLNLMKLAMGEFGEKVEVTLLTRKRNNANESNCEKIKLMNKRFAYLSEPEDGEKINVGLLKELTGSEEIVARGLYQESMSFVMETKLFLACNELPDIKGEDTAIWRRIRVVDFPSRFVDDPKESNEFEIDRSLPSRMREDITWRQTFMNILINYFPLNIPEPKEVQLKTSEYRQETNEIELWCKENIEYSKDSILELNDVSEKYFNRTTVSQSEKTKIKKELEKYIKKFHKNIDFEYKRQSIDNSRKRCWIHLKLK